MNWKNELVETVFAVVIGVVLCHLLFHLPITMGTALWCLLGSGLYTGFKWICIKLGEM